MWASLVIFISMALIIIVAIELRERKRQKQRENRPSTLSENKPQRPEGCCGEHLVCERETLLNTKPEIVYYDDEELDQLANLQPDEFTQEQRKALSDVFYSLKAEDVSGWCRSLQLRNIELPADIREEALLIVREQRNR